MSVPVRLRCRIEQAVYSTGILGSLLLSGCGITSTSTNSPSSTGANSSSSASVQSGAQLGAAWNAADATLRPVLGVPGSAQFGSSLVSAGSYINGAFSAQSQSALLVDKSGNLSFIATPGSQPALLSTGVATNAVIAFSPLGSYAVVYFPGANTAMLVKGLPQQPTAASLQMASAMQAATVSDAGTILAASRAGGRVSLITLTAAGAQTTVASVAAYGGMVFLPGSEDILFADSAANTLTRLHSGSGQTLATATDGLNKPLAVAASLDGHWAVTANSADGTLVRIDLTAATPTIRSTCACTPSILTPLKGNAVFQLTAPGAAATWMIEADDLLPRVLFIPPVGHGV